MYAKTTWDLPVRSACRKAACLSFSPSYATPSHDLCMLHVASLPKPFTRPSNQNQVTLCHNHIHHWSAQRQQVLVPPVRHGCPQALLTPGSTLSLYLNHCSHTDAVSTYISMKKSPPSGSTFSNFWLPLLSGIFDWIHLPKKQCKSMEKEVVCTLPSQIFNSTDLKCLCRGFTKRRDCMEKLPELPRTDLLH